MMIIISREVGHLGKLLINDTKFYEFVHYNHIGHKGDYRLKILEALLQPAFLQPRGGWTRSKRHSILLRSIAFFLVVFHVTLNSLNTKKLKQQG